MTNRRRTCRSIRCNCRTEIVPRTARRCLHRRRRKNFRSPHFVREIVRRTLRKAEDWASLICEKRAACVIQNEVLEVMSCSRSESYILQTRRNLQRSTETETGKKFFLMMSCNPTAFIFCTIDERNQRVRRNVISDHLQQVQRTVGRVCRPLDRLRTGDEIERSSFRAKTADHWSEWIRLLIRIFVDDTRCKEIQSDWMTAWILSDDVDWKLTWTCKKNDWRKKSESLDMYAGDNQEPMRHTFYFVNRNHARQIENTIPSSE